MIIDDKLTEYKSNIETLKAIESLEVYRWLISLGKKLQEGFSVITDKDINEKNNRKINFYYELFSNLKIPNPSINDWNDWKKNMTNNKPNLLNDSEKICFINQKLNYGTRSSSLISLPNKKKNYKNIVFKATNSFPSIDNYTDVIF